MDRCINDRVSGVGVDDRSVFSYTAEFTRDHPDARYTCSHSFRNFDIAGRDMADTPFEKKGRFQVPHLQLLIWRHHQAEKRYTKKSKRSSVASHDPCKYLRTKPVLLCNKPGSPGTPHTLCGYQRSSVHARNPIKPRIHRRTGKLRGYVYDSTPEYLFIDLPITP